NTLNLNVIIYNSWFYFQFVEMMALDIGDSSQVYAAFLVFLDLVEARNWTNMTYKGSKELELVYLQGCPGEEEEVKVVVPLPVHTTISHEGIRRIMECVCNQSKRAFILAIVDSDSTVVYYQLTDGFVVPDPPQISEGADGKLCKKKRRRFHR
ncbi:tRNA-splicing endonuclease subunit Sen15, partial [Amblyraja radiata]|uniref:tRNA-splicing endonuclease subunit Sen15 n=1 Tax=Amblyraja radiata TaxID=386614 RepID=UPI00140423B6